MLALAPGEGLLTRLGRKLRMCAFKVLKDRTLARFAHLPSFARVQDTDLGDRTDHIHQDQLFRL